ncbi:MAG: UMP kinase [Patescibacteria group bacterium]|nr:UMP kinase [Patescibacteria group bacterium]
MEENRKNIAIVSLGGSMLAPDLPDPVFVKAFVSLITERVKKGRRFIIVTGGGKTCRNYQEALKKVRNITDEENDWMGIYTTHFNGQFLRLAFGDLAHQEVITEYGTKPSFDEAILIGGGEVPGHSTDYDAVLLANMFGAKHIVNVSNTTYVYTADPRKDKDAKALPRLTWEEYLSYIPAEWTPGLSTPFDPTAAKLAHENGLSVAIVNGQNLGEVAKALDEEDFEGSFISS